MAVNVLFIFLCSILVLLMTPGLAFFYGGMVPRRDINNTLMAVFIMCCVPVLLWVVCGYSLSFSGNNWNLIGNLHNFFLHNVKLNAGAPTTGGSITNIAFLIFQMMFAVITPALFVGAVVERINFRFLLLFVVLWSLFVYYPLVHIVWGGGFLQSLGVLDFAGGLVVHINAGVTALLLAYFLGPRLIKEKGSPKSLSWVLLGTTFLWIGWYGFNAGSAFAINGIAMQAMLTTTVATATAMLIWIILDVFTKRNATLFGICSGAICGLVAITPACGYVSIESAMIIGALATMASYGFITVIKPLLKVDDTLDAFGCHGVSGIMGSVLTGLFASKAINPVVTHNGWLAGGNFHQFGIQLGATLFTVVFTVVVVTIIVLILKRIMSMRMRHEEEIVKREMTES
ncbi:ammonium transporter [Fructilactobacillus myrtifloralis]|uniref:Ammonium transporter n=1 Tax=Fructilactobacillus myrtifloralis TaxID=2940301 RepID=A0ABY5BTR4_9LACO|nr:ammonium transporter [Fructilactobacillus myrtifloralis]USS85749.1 ammonium transporter [Fructilactobacillus myrtifloralis]